MNKICFGCGAKLQSLNINEEGYIPKENGAYCKRCYQIIHYGLESVSSAPKDNNIIIKSINNDDKFVIFLADFLSINSKVINLFKSINNNKILVISKTDLITKSIKETTIKTFLKKQYNITEDIKLLSSVNNYGVESLTDYLYKRNIKASYVVGLTNSGKSTFINKLIENNQSNINQITTSYIQNTTLDFIRIKINNNLTIIDSPGFVINTKYRKINKHSDKSYLKPKTFQMKENETIKIDDMYIKFSDKTSITLYMGSDIEAKKHYKEIDYNLNLLIPGNSDLIISGLGFINIKSRTKIYISSIDKDLIEVRESIFGAYE